MLCSALLSWLDATTLKTMVRRNRETVFQSLETQNQTGEGMEMRGEAQSVS